MSQCHALGSQDISAIGHAEKNVGPLAATINNVLYAPLDELKRGYRGLLFSPESNVPRHVVFHLL